MTEAIFCPFFYQKNASFIRVFKGINGQRITLKSILHGITFENEEKYFDLSLPDEFKKLLDILCILKRYLNENDAEFSHNVFTLSQGDKIM